MRGLYPIIWPGLIISLGIGLTLASLTFVRPEDCRSLCLFSRQTPCPGGACRPMEQRAGFPLPILIDNGGGSSPTGGWGKLGPEDMPNPVFFLADIVFYCIPLWFLWVAVRVFRRKEEPGALLRMAPLLALAILFLMIGVITDPSLSPHFW